MLFLCELKYSKMCNTEEEELNRIPMNGTCLYSINGDYIRNITTTSISMD